MFDGKFQVKSGKFRAVFPVSIQQVRRVQDTHRDNALVSYTWLNGVDAIAADVLFAAGEVLAERSNERQDSNTKMKKMFEKKSNSAASCK